MRAVGMNNERKIRTGCVPNKKTVPGDNIAGFTTSKIHEIELIPGKKKKNKTNVFVKAFVDRQICFLKRLQ